MIEREEAVNIGRISTEAPRSITALVGGEPIAVGCGQRICLVSTAARIPGNRGVESAESTCGVTFFVAGRDTISAVTNPRRTPLCVRYRFESAAVCERLCLEPQAECPSTVDGGTEKGTQMNIHGESSYTSTGDELEALSQARHRRAASVTDRGRACGFGFVEMPDADGRKAIDGARRILFSGRKLNVNEARPRQQR